CWARRKTPRDGAHPGPQHRRTLTKVPRLLKYRFQFQLVLVLVRALVRVLEIAVAVWSEGFARIDYEHEHEHEHEDEDEDEDDSPPQPSILSYPIHNPHFPSVTNGILAGVPWVFVEANVTPAERVTPCRH